jgi:hypothetical protein
MIGSFFFKMVRKNDSQHDKEGSRGAENEENAASESSSSSSSDSNKRARLEQPDVIIAVGDEEFEHYSHVLCIACDYFDAAMNSGMQEASSKRFEFPEGDPETFELFMSAIQPCSTVSVNASNVEDILPWADLLGASRMLSICDEALCKYFVNAVFKNGRVHSSVYPAYDCPARSSEVAASECTCLGSLRESQVQAFSKHFQSLVKALSLACSYGLDKSKDAAGKKLGKFVSTMPDVLSEEMLTQVISLANADKEAFVLHLWPALKSFLPKSLADQDPSSSSLASNELLVPLLKSEMDRREFDHTKIRERIQMVKLIKDLPQDLYSRMPEETAISIGSERIHVKNHVRRKLRAVIYDSFPADAPAGWEDEDDY